MAGAISLEDAKAYLRVDGGDEDAVIERMIDAAARHIESTYGVVSREREESFLFDGLPAKIRIPRIPVDLATIGVTYLDTEGTTQIIDGARANERDGWIWLSPAMGTDWPANVAAVGALTVTASIGYVEDASPDDVKQATRMIVDHWFSTRDFSLPPPNVDFLVDHYRFRRV
ncbi:phage conserved hypothetical protein, phiE125 gp8 family [Sphingobium faniae]|nr:phage conserved hypothetical protein, phiE125 gp8 family [Sphingobium faniae]